RPPTGWPSAKEPSRAEARQRPGAIVVAPGPPGLEPARRSRLLRQPRWQRRLSESHGGQHVLWISWNGLLCMRFLTCRTGTIRRNICGVKTKQRITLTFFMEVVTLTRSSLIVVFGMALSACSPPNSDLTSTPAASPPPPASPAPTAPSRVTAGWTVTEGVDAPESVYVDTASGSIFVSIIGGMPGDRDGN